MNDALETLAAISVAAGTFFAVVGVLGMLRLPDVYCRLHAAGKVSVFGTSLLALACLFAGVGVWGRELLLIGLLAVAGPVLSHAIGAAAWRLGQRGAGSGGRSAGGEA
ncbi:MAG: cation:proton antiporter [Phycisphaeraceae bacterium]